MSQLCNMSYNTIQAGVFCSCGSLLFHEISKGMQTWDVAQLREYWKEIKASRIRWNALNPLQCPWTDLNQLKRNILQPLSFTIRVSLFPNVFYQLVPQLYKIKYKQDIAGYERTNTASSKIRRQIKSTLREGTRTSPAEDIVLCCSVFLIHFLHLYHSGVKERL